MLDGSVPGEEEAPDEKHEFHEEPELDRPVVAGAILVFAGQEAEVEANGDKVIDVVGSGIVGGSFHSNYRAHDIQGGGLFSSDGGIFDPIGLELPREALVEPGVCLGVGRFSGVRKTIQEVGCCNLPPCLRN